MLAHLVFGSDTGLSVDEERNLTIEKPAA